MGWNTGVELSVAVELDVRVEPGVGVEVGSEKRGDGGGSVGTVKVTPPVVLGAGARSTGVATASIAKMVKGRMEDSFIVSIYEGCDIVVVDDGCC